MDARGILAKLRQGEALSQDELTWFASGLASGAVSDAQAGAFAMAVVLKGLGEAGRVALTRSMTESGEVLSWDLPGPVLDKHSTGGIGDCVSLILAPALAACGAYVPMISGRGLGHTGGTLDKLEAIPGVNTQVSVERLQRMTQDVGCAIVGATAKIAPADARLYSIRDVSATVESIDLITASILSKKLAAGLSGLVLDVKVGSGAFMAEPDDAIALAEALVQTANGAGCPADALVTDMNEPVVPALGNALEVAMVMEVLTRGEGRSRIEHLVAELGAVLLARAGLVADVDAGLAAVGNAVTSGQAADIFGKMVSAMGGPMDFLERWRSYQPEASAIVEVGAATSGFVAQMDGRALGEVVVLLGGGRQVEGDQIDPSVGLSDVLSIGSRVSVGDPLARVHAASEAAAEAAADVVRSAFTIAPTAPEAAPLIYERLS